MIFDNFNGTLCTQPALYHSICKSEHNSVYIMIFGVHLGNVAFVLWFYSKANGFCKLCIRFTVNNRLSMGENMGEMAFVNCA